MTSKQIEAIKDSAYMVLCGYAFILRPKNFQNALTIVNLKDSNQKSEYFYNTVNGVFTLKTSNMSEVKKYQSMAILERNRDFLREGLLENG